MCTTPIIEPPLMNGGIAARSSRRPQSTPIPLGPSILCPEKARKSTSNAATSTGMCGTDWQASSNTRAPTSRARAVMVATGLIVPTTLDWCANATSFVRSLTSSFRSDRSRRPSSVTENQRSVAPVRRHNCCQGTRLAWCSISVTTISSPGPTWNLWRSSSAVAALLIAYATRLTASVAFLVNTTSSESAPMNDAIVSRADS